MAPGSCEPSESKSANMEKQGLNPERKTWLAHALQSRLLVLMTLTTSKGQAGRWWALNALGPSPSLSASVCAPLFAHSKSPQALFSLLPVPISLFLAPTSF